MVLNLTCTIRRFIFKNKLWYLFIVFSIVSCDETFIYDPIDPRLPMYTEKGYGTAGAYVNDSNIWISEKGWAFSGSYDLPSFNLWQENDSLVISFDGESNNKDMLIEFHLRHLNITSFNELQNLANNKILLDGTENTAFYIEKNDKYRGDSILQEIYKNKGVGQFYVKNVQMNDSLTSAIVSGTFGFSITDTKGAETKISCGRFDYKIKNSDNYFRIKK